MVPPLGDRGYEARARPWQPKEHIEVIAQARSASRLSCWREMAMPSAKPEEDGKLRSLLHRPWSPLTFSEKCTVLATVALPMLLLVGAYYLLTWGGLPDFVLAVDHHDHLFEDFSAHFYPMGNRLLEDPRPVRGYYYSAFSAVLFVPFGTLDPGTARWLWGVLQVASLLALAALPLWRGFGLTALGVVISIGAWATSFPLLHNLKWGQVSVPLVVCSVAAFCAYAAGRRLLTGSLIALAAAVKYYPALFLVYFIMKRDSRVCVSFAVALFMFYFVVPAIVIGPYDWLHFERSSLGNIYSMSWPAQDVNSQYIAHVGSRWFRLLFQEAAPSVFVRILAVSGYLIAFLNMWVVWLTLQRCPRKGHTLSLVTLLLSLPFVIRTSWPHYFAYLPFCQSMVWACLVSHGPTFNPRQAVLCAVVLASMACSSVFVFNLCPDWSVYSSYGVLFIANALLLACVYGIVAGLDGYGDRLNKRLGGC